MNASGLEIVLLGATGFVGSAVLRRLTGGPHHDVRVHALVRDPARLPATPAGASLRVVQGDLAKPPRDVFPPEPHIVVHLATKQTGPDRGFTSNVTDARALVDALPDSTRGILYGSSTSVYGRGAHIDVDESHALEPGTALAQSRAAVERALLDAARHRGVTAYCLRPRVLFGHGDRQTLPGLERMVRGRVQPGSGRQRFTVVDVDDYARFLVTLARRIGDGAAPEQRGVNVGYTRTLSLEEIVTVIRRAHALPGPAIRVPAARWLIESLRRVPAGARVAARLELYGLDHSYRVENARQLPGGEIFDGDPLQRFEAAVLTTLQPASRAGAPAGEAGRRD